MAMNEDREKLAAMLKALHRWPDLATEDRLRSYFRGYFQTSPNQHDLDIIRAALSTWSAR
jgi:hypothetical protein